MGIPLNIFPFVIIIVTVKVFLTYLIIILVNNYAPRKFDRKRSWCSEDPLEKVNKPCTWYNSVLKLYADFFATHGANRRLLWENFKRPVLMHHVRKVKYWSEKNWTGFGRNLYLIWAKETMVFAMHAQTA